MTLFQDRYKITVVGSDGLMHSDFVSHVIIVDSAKFNLVKSAKKPIQNFTCVDTKTGRHLTHAELDQVSIF